MNNPIITASGAIPAYACVKVSTSGSERVEVATSAADVVFGVTLAANTPAGGAVNFQTTDSQLDIFTLKAAGNIAIGQYVVPTTNGEVIGATTGPFVALDPATTGQTFTARKFNAGATANFIAPGTGAITRTLDSKLGDMISVKDFGAVGDGTTDDRAAIQAGLESCITLGKTLFFPKGTYAMSSFHPATAGSAIQLNLVNPVGVLSMVGDNATIKTTVTSHASHMLYVRAAENGKDINLEGLTFDANFKSQSGFRHDERNQGLTTVTVNNCTFKNGLGLASAPTPPLLWTNSTGLSFVGGYKFINVTNSSFLNYKREPTPTDAAGNFETTGMSVAVNTEGPGEISLVTFTQNVNVSGCYFNDINNNQTAAVPANANADGLKIFGGNTAVIPGFPSTDYLPSTATVSNNHFIDCQGRAIKIQNDESVVINNTVRYAVRPINSGSTQINLQLECGVISNNIFHYDIAPVSRFGAGNQNPFAETEGAGSGIKSFPLGYFSGLATNRPRMYTVSDNIVLNNVPEATGVMGGFVGWSEATASSKPVFITISGNKISGPLKIFGLATTRNSGGICTAIIKDNMMSKLTSTFLATSAATSFAFNRFEVSGNVNANPTPVPHLTGTSDFVTILNGDFNANRNQNIGVGLDLVQNIGSRGFLSRANTISDSKTGYSASLNTQTITAPIGSEVVFPTTGFHWSNSGLRILMTDSGGQTNFVFMQDTSGISSISAGSNIAFNAGGTDPVAASKLNVYLGDAHPDLRVKLFNRTGAEMVVTMFSFG